jgi:hypothetical protein
LLAAGAALGLAGRFILLGACLDKAIQTASHLGRFGGHFVGVDGRGISVAALEARQDIGFDHRLVDHPIELRQFGAQAFAHQLQQQDPRPGVGRDLAACPLEAGP